LEVVLPVGDERNVKFNGKDAERITKDERGRAHFRGLFERSGARE
jgi:hypothetical protein